MRQHHRRHHSARPLRRAGRWPAQAWRPRDADLRGRRLHSWRGIASLGLLSEDKTPPTGDFYSELFQDLHGPISTDVKSKSSQVSGLAGVEGPIAIRLSWWAAFLLRDATPVPRELVVGSTLGQPDQGEGVCARTARSSPHERGHTSIPEAATTLWRFAEESSATRIARSRLIPKASSFATSSTAPS